MANRTISLSAAAEGLVKVTEITLANLVAAASGSTLVRAKPYLVTVLPNVDMLAIGTSNSTYTFVGTLLLGPSDTIPTGYNGIVARTA
jgi:hypothetical protein